jgi:foldase protein PrsA
MRALRILLVLALGAGTFALAGCGGSKSESVPPGAVAVVNGTAITAGELEALVARVRQSYANNKQQFPKAGTPEYQALQSQAVAYLVQRTEYEQQAEQLGVAVSDKEVADKAAQYKKQYFDGNEQKFRKQLQDQGMTPEQFQSDVRFELLSSKLYDAITGGVKVTDTDIRAYYVENKDQYTVPESREVRHILIAEQTKGKVDYPKSKALADDLYEQLRGGADFTALAKKYSDDPGSKDAGGKLTVVRGQFVAPFEQTAFLLDKGTISRPVKTEYGYHLIEPLSEAKAGSTTPLEKVKEQISSTLAGEKKQEAVSAWADKVETEYEGKVAYAEGYAPPEAATDTTG